MTPAPALDLTTSLRGDFLVLLHFTLNSCTCSPLSTGMLWAALLGGGFAFLVGGLAGASRFLGTHFPSGMSLVKHNLFTVLCKPHHLQPPPPPYVHPHTRNQGRRFPPPPGGNGHQYTQQKFFSGTLGTCDFLLISYSSWAK